MTNQSAKWDLRILGLAELVGKWSKDPATKVGAVITNGKRVISLGFNGFSQGVDDNPERYNDREEKLKLIIHAEMNAILFAEHPITGYTLYCTPFLPCVRCAAIVIQTGIARVVSWNDDLENSKWAEDFKKADVLYGEAGVIVSTYNRQQNISDGTFEGSWNVKHV